MTIKEKVNALIGPSAARKATLIDTLIEMTTEEATNYCNLEEYTTKLDNAVVEMVIERYNKVGPGRTARSENRQWAGMSRIQGRNTGSAGRRCTHQWHKRPHSQAPAGLQGPPQCSDPAPASHTAGPRS